MKTCEYIGKKEKGRSRTEKYKLLEEKKGLGVVLKELKQRLQAKSIKIKRYEQRIEQYISNKFHYSTKKRKHSFGILKAFFIQHSSEYETSVQQDRKQVCQQLTDCSSKIKNRSTNS